MSKVRLLFASDAAGLGERIATALAETGRPLAFGVADASDLDPAPVRATLVVWSPQAVADPEIMWAARAALAERSLVPVTTGAVDEPDDFDLLQPANLAGWKGDAADPRWRFVLDELDLASRASLDIAPAAAGRSVSALSSIAAAPWPLIGAGVLAAFLATGIAAFQLGKERAADRVAQSAPLPPEDAAPAEPETPILAPVIDLRDEDLAQIDDMPAQAAPDEAGIDDAAPDLAPAGPESPVSQDAPSADEVDGPLPEDAEPAAEPLAEPETQAVGSAPGEPRVKPAAAEVAPPSETEDDPIAELAWAATNGGAGGVFLGNYFKECVDCPDMAVAPAGSFLFGAPESEAQSEASERPQVAVRIEREFALSTHEVTVAEWQACHADRGCLRPAPNGGPGRSALPVTGVSYAEALDYARWLSRRTGGRYRLPSEAEWEYAARAGGAGPFHFGDRLSTSLANYHGDYPYGGPKGAFRGGATPVGAFPPNAFGLYDMHGNVWEWTADCWRDSHAGAPEDGRPVGGACEARVVKGGAWTSGGWRLRAAHRQPARAGAREPDIGFRVARDME